MDILRNIKKEAIWNAHRLEILQYSNTVRNGSRLMPANYAGIMLGIMFGICPTLCVIHPQEHMPAINVQHYVHHYVKIYDNISRAFLVYADLNQVDHFQLI